MILAWTQLRIWGFSRFSKLCTSTSNSLSTGFSRKRTKPKIDCELQPKTHSDESSSNANEHSSFRLPVFNQMYSSDAFYTPTQTGLLNNVLLSLDTAGNAGTWSLRPQGKQYCLFEGWNLDYRLYIYKPVSCSMARRESREKQVQYEPGLPALVLKGHCV